jgi:hypothetical protein
MPKFVRDPYRPAKAVLLKSAAYILNYTENKLPVFFDLRTFVGFICDALTILIYSISHMLMPVRNLIFGFFTEKHCCYLMSCAGLPHKNPLVSLR